MQESALTTEESFEELQRYVRFSGEDARLLAACRPVVAPFFAAIAAVFYERSREHDEAHAVFQSEKQIERLQSSLVGWLERVFGGSYGEEFFDKTQRVGDVHVRIGLPQRYVITAIGVARTELCAVFDAHLGAAALATRDALGRLFDVELAIMLEVYRSDLVRRIERSSQLTNLDGPIKPNIVAAVDAAPVLVVEIDGAGKIALFNRTAERVTGWARDEVLGKPYLDLLVPEDLRPEAVRRMAGDGTFDASIPTRTGNLRSIRWHFARTTAAETFAFGADITDEDEHRARTARANRLAAAGTLVAGLAHEIRNPLNGAGLHLAILERQLAKEGSAETRETVRVIQGELRRLATLVTDFLDFARPKPMTPAPIDARSLCGRAIDSVREVAEAANVKVATDLPAQDLVLEADALGLEQVLIRLLENSIEALGPKGGNVIVRARREPRHVWIEVEDDGPGLPDATAPIFDAFYSTKPEATGLGLAVAHRVLSDHDGAIDVDSRPGCTRFRLTLPLSRQGTPK